MRYNGRLGIILMDYPGEELIKHLISQNAFDGEKKEIIKNGDLVYVIHNDTHKYLFLDNNDKENNIYCVKEPVPLIIQHKNSELVKDTFKVNDTIVLIRGDEYKYEYEFQIGSIYSGKDEIIDENSLITLKVNKNGEMKYLESCYENKNSKKHYLFNYIKSKGGYESLFIIKKILKRDKSLI